jgi:hypothetical protein
MATIDEFERVQQLLGRPARPRAKTREFAYTGMIRCGECGFTVTAEAEPQADVAAQQSRFEYLRESGSMTTARKDTTIGKLSWPREVSSRNG